MHSSISDVLQENLVTGNHSIHISVLMSWSLINLWCLTVCAWFRREICWATCPLCRCYTVTQSSQTLTHTYTPKTHAKLTLLALIRAFLIDWGRMSCLITSRPSLHPLFFLSPQLLATVLIWHITTLGRARYEARWYFMNPLKKSTGNRSIHFPSNSILILTFLFYIFLQ